MDDIGRKFKSFDWKNLSRQAKKVQASTASALKDMVMTDLENKVRAATGDTSWGASSADLALIAGGTYNREDFTLIMSIVWQRLASSRWRCVYKALDVLKYLVLHGAARVLDDARDAMPHLRRLEHFAFVDPATRRDEGANVRARAAAFVGMLNDDAALDAERSKSEELRAKIGAAAPPGASGQGALSSDDYRYGGSAGLPDDDRALTAGGGGGRYDEDPRSARAHDVSVDDLLGGPVDAPAAQPAGVGLGELGAGATAPATNGQPAAFSLMGDDDDDDGDFDPRNGGSAHVPMNGGLNGMMNGGLNGGLNGAAANGVAANGGGMNGAGANGAASNGGAPATSQLVANLVAAQAAAADKAASDREVTRMQQAAKKQEAPVGAPATAGDEGGLGGLMQAEAAKMRKAPTAGVAAATSPMPSVAPAGAAAAPQKQDPFADLLKGVL